MPDSGLYACRGRLLINSITNELKIDVHNHAIPEPALDLLDRQPVYGVKIEGGRWRGGTHVDFEVARSFVDPEAKLAELERNALDAAVISVAPPLFYYHVDAEAGEAMARAVNEGLAQMCASAPKRLGWLAAVPLQAPERAAVVLEDAVAAGCVGVEIGSSVAGQRLDDEEFDPFWALASSLTVPVTMHPAYTEGVNPALAPWYLENVLGFLFDTTVAVERLICAGVLDRHPGVRLVLLHGGGYFPYQAGRLRHAKTVRPELADAPRDPWDYLDRLHFDTITHDIQALAYLVGRVGAGRVLMGTDLPFDMASAAPLQALEAAVGEKTAGRIAQRNPAELYGFAADA
jgi:aminocarboxymuconate-semialdehyde decarboxylase